MSMPKSVVKFSKDGITYISSVDRVNYTIRELTRAALRDVGRFVSRTCNDKAVKLRGLTKKKGGGFMSRRVKGRTSAFQFWNRAKETDLQVGIKHNTWYGVEQELGTHNQPKRGILRSSVYDNISTIIEIESQYLSALESEAAALAKIESEDDYQGGDED